MANDSNKRQNGLSRRSFLKGVGAAVVASPALAGQNQPQPGPNGRSRIVEITSKHAVTAGTLHPAIISEMVTAGLQAITQKSSPKDAWRHLLKPTDIVGLKFNQSGQRNIATTTVVGGAIIESLSEAGWSPRQIICIEAPQDVYTRYSTHKGTPGYAPEMVDFGSGRDQLARVLDEVTAIINIPFLKTHNIAGLTCSMKNLSHGLVKHPARYHGNGCSPFVGDIVALEQIRSKLRLCLVDAMRLVYKDGPEATVENVDESGTLIFGIDPVATDTIGFVHLNDTRRVKNLPPIGDTSTDIAYLRAAAEKGVGTADLHAIERIKLTA